MQATHHAQPPPGWTATQFPDGSVRLRRSRLDRADPSAMWFYPTLLLVMTLLATGPGRDLYERNPWLVFGIGVTLVPFSVLVVVMCVLSGVEEWHLRPGSLEIRKRILGRERTKRYADVELRFRQVHRRGRTMEERPWQLLALQSGRLVVFCESSWRGAAGVLDRGNYVSAVTGWPFHAAPGDPVTDGFTRFGE